VSWFKGLIQSSFTRLFQLRTTQTCSNSSWFLRRFNPQDLYLPETVLLSRQQTQSRRLLIKKTCQKMCMGRPDVVAEFLEPRWEDTFDPAPPLSSYKDNHGTAEARVHCVRECLRASVLATSGPRRRRAPRSDVITACTTTG